MDSSPLVKAHDHARSAANATHTSDTTVAINEHTRAAGEFANAAKNTNSTEALRTLKLLEQHHQRLSELLQMPFKRRESQTSQEPAENDSQNDEKADATAGATPDDGVASSGAAGGPDNEKAQPQSMPTLTRQAKHPARDLGASIANNLASKRGIRSRYRTPPLSPSLSNAEAGGNVEAGSRRAGSRSKMQNMLEHSDKPNTTGSPENSPKTKSIHEDSASHGDVESSTNDEGFGRFYNAFGSIINRISAPLAFAGLPLVSEEPEETAPAPESPVSKRNRLNPSPAVPAEPDLSKIYSKATMKAISRDGQSTTDSFYVVPTSGHTVSYANILNFADKEKRRMGASLHSDIPEEVDEEDFVDARESQYPGSSSAKRRAGKGAADNREVTQHVEELYLENKSLKDMLDKLSKRLHAFESMSQNSGMRLAESMRLMRPGSPHALVSSKGSGSGEDALAKKNRELEEQLKVQSQRMEQLEKEYKRATANLTRYRDRWDQLKAGAKARRAGGTQSTSEMGEDDPQSPRIG